VTRTEHGGRLRSVTDGDNEIVPRRSDAALLAELEAIAARRKAILQELAGIHRRRDLVMIALYRRGCSLRKIAAAAGIHYTRVRQIITDVDMVSSRAGLAKIHPKHHKHANTRRETGPRSDAKQTPPDAP
jgi:hypothetical protein